MADESTPLLATEQHARARPATSRRRSPGLMRGILAISCIALAMAICTLAFAITVLVLIKTGPDRFVPSWTVADTLVVMMVLVSLEPSETNPLLGLGLHAHRLSVTECLRGPFLDQQRGALVMPRPDAAMAAERRPRRHYRQIWAGIWPRDSL